MGGLPGEDEGDDDGDDNGDDDGDDDGDGGDDSIDGYKDDLRFRALDKNLLPQNIPFQKYHFIKSTLIRLSALNNPKSFCRFATALKSHAEKDPLILFSGDIFAPSISKTVHKYPT